MAKFIMVGNNIISVADVICVVPMYSTSGNYHKIIMREGKEVRLYGYSDKKQMEMELKALLYNLNS